MTTMLVLLAGGLGAASRYVVERAVSARRPDWPWGTFTVNVTGCFVLGLLTSLAYGTVLTVLGTGLAGGYTTFSAYAIEIVKLDTDRSRATAAAYAVGSVLAGIAAARLGLAVGRLVG